MTWQAFGSTRIIAIAMLGLVGCAPATTSTPTQAAAVEDKPVVPAAAAPAAAPVPTLPISINAVMVALVDYASEPLWVDAYQPPTTADGWREAEYNAYQMAVSGKLIQLAGTGPNDADWVLDPAWTTMANTMSDAGMTALAAAQAKDVNALNAAGDVLVATCESCHVKFKPGLTSMGIYKSPNYPPKDGVK
jgi:hypothetical protein